MKHANHVICFKSKFIPLMMVFIDSDQQNPLAMLDPLAKRRRVYGLIKHVEKFKLSTFLFSRWPD